MHQPCISLLSELTERILKDLSMVFPPLHDSSAFQPSILGFLPPPLKPQLVWGWPKLNPMPLRGNLPFYPSRPWAPPMSSKARSVRRDTCEKAASTCVYSTLQTLCLQRETISRVLERKGHLSGSFHAFLTASDRALCTGNTLCLVSSRPWYILLWTGSCTFSSWMSRVM